MQRICGTVLPECCSTCFAQLWIQGRRQRKIRNRTAKDVISNVCEVNLNLAYVFLEPLLRDCFALLETGGGGEIQVNWHCYQNNEKNPCRPFRSCWNQVFQIILVVFFPATVLKHACKDVSSNKRRHEVTCSAYSSFSSSSSFATKGTCICLLLWCYSFQRNNCRQQTSLFGLSAA